MPAFPTACSWFELIRSGTRGSVRSPFTPSGSPCSNPSRWSDAPFPVGLYYTPKALWKLSWFLRDFAYDPDLLGRDEIEDKSLVGLRGIVKISHVVVNGHTVVNLDAFAPAGAWESISSPASPLRSELAS